MSKAFKHAAAVLDNAAGKFVGDVDSIFHIHLHDSGTEEATNKGVTSTVSVNELVLIDRWHGNVTFFLFLFSEVPANDLSGFFTLSSKNNSLLLFVSFFECLGHLGDV